MGDGERGDQEAHRLCERCSKATELLTVLPRTTGNPRFWIYACVSCGFVEWIADKVEP
jgi:hypothetical protein